MFREVNDCIDELLHRFCVEEEADFLCECPSAGCVRLLPLSRAEYEGIRRSGGFVVSPECARWLNAARRTDRYVVVDDFGRLPLMAVA